MQKRDGRSVEDLLRFRAWDTFDEEMVNDIFFSWQDCGYESLNECLSDERWKFMQSTGMFDKNGQEVFEGDVVKIFGDKLSKIYYSDGAFCVDILNGGTPLHAFLSEHLEVIGNIYENPEILEAEL